VLNQLALPVSVKFNNSLGDTATPPVPTAVNEATTEYVDLLLDLDELVNTDTAFQVGGWIEQAKALAAQQPGTDCVAKGFPEITSCEAFYEWNAKVQSKALSVAHSRIRRRGRCLDPQAVPGGEGAGGKRWWRQVLVVVVALGLCGFWLFFATDLLTFCRV